MLPWFATFDDVNYTRWEIVFLADMKWSPCTAPVVHQGLQHGDFVAKETKMPMTKLLSTLINLAKWQEGS